MTALGLFAAMPRDLVLLIARFAGAKSAPPAEKTTTVASVFGVSGLRPEPLPGLGAWTRGCYGDF